MPGIDPLISELLRFVLRAQNNPLGAPLEPLKCCRHAAGLLNQKLDCRAHRSQCFTNAVLVSSANEASALRPVIVQSAE
jgi:hypothetical protein